MDSSHKIIIITAPSGAGKTSITRHLLKTFPDKLAFSVSAATRQQRDHEKDGVDYHFMSIDEFKEKIQHNSFVEWEMVYEGKYYGTLKSEIHRIWEQEKTGDEDHQQDARDPNYKSDPRTPRWVVRVHFDIAIV